MKNLGKIQDCQDELKRVYLDFLKSASHSPSPKVKKMSQTLAKVYDPRAIEQEWYAFWEERGFFQAHADDAKDSFCITIPPPNVTGELHMGHAIQHAIHDLVIRWKRMQGFETLCLPGTDHAGIATQMKVEEELARSAAQTRYDVGREALMERIWAWKDRYGEAIYDQLRKMGCSYDWQRARFTLDKGYVEAVLKAFEQFHEKGWIYRGTRMINWCPNCATVISDLETEEKVLDGHLWHIRYPGTDGGPDVVVATTRPETMLGDTGVAVHPGDRRWKEAIGKEVLLPLVERKIPIVADDYADPELGSGAVKLTPAHDPNDYDVGQRHNLPHIQVIGFDGAMTEEAGFCAGQDRYTCRQHLVEALEAAGLMEGVEEHEHAVPHHDKCGTVIEPLPMEQWFMNMKPLAQQTLPYLQRGDIAYVPGRFRDYAIEWLENIRDWALSRQIWWGHRIPAWYCLSCSAPGLIPMGDVDPERAFEEGSFRVSLEQGARPIVSQHRPSCCPLCQGVDLVQDPDVLDTWFSSALWPFATLGWPQKNADLAYFHPTDLMITARDILYLWVLRMVMTATEFVDEIPFKTVLVHPTVLTRDGRRMSKSLGTGLNPLDLVELYGTDATRFSLLHQAGAVQDIRFDAEIENNQVRSSPSAEAGRNFCNKLWNAVRFALMNLQDYNPEKKHRHFDELADRWIRSRLGQTIQEVDSSLAAYRFSDVTRALYDFLWRDFCDWYLELVKGLFASGNSQTRQQAQQTLLQVLEAALKMMHPVMPFVTEALWQALPLEGSGKPPSIMVASWPQTDPAWADPGAEKEMDLLRQVITAVRTIRGDMNIPTGKKVKVLVSCSGAEVEALFKQQQASIELLARAETVRVGRNLPQPPASGSAVLAFAEVYVPLEGLIDLNAEEQRLQKEIGKFQGLLKGLDAKLANEGFLNKAPAPVIERERERQNEYRAGLAKLEASLELLRS